MRLQLDPRHDWVLVIDPLREWHVKHRPRRPSECKPSKLRVAHDTHDAEGINVFRYVEAEVLIQRVLASLEKPLHERFVHNRYGRCTFVIGSGERTPAEDSYTEVLKIVSAYPIPGGARFLADLGSRMPRHQDQLTPIVGERVIQRQARSLDSRQTVEACFKAAVKCGQFRLCVSGWGPVHRNDDPVSNLISEILVLQFVEASRQHGCTGDQHNG